MCSTEVGCGYPHIAVYAQRDLRGKSPRALSSLRGLRDAFLCLP